MFCAVVLYIASGVTATTMWAFRVWLCAVVAVVAQASSFCAGTERPLPGVGGQVPAGVQQWVRKQLGPRYELLRHHRRRRAAASALQYAVASGAACLKNPARVGHGTIFKCV